MILLLLGEPGVGKSRTARAIHRASGRTGDFVPYNCGRLLRALADSVINGYERGAFSGADAARAGLFEQARRGTLFLDEIGDLDLDVQEMLLDVLEERCVRRMGSATTIPIDARVIFATNKDLEAEVQAGRFREDLYWRISAWVFEVLPLRERTAEIRGLVESMLEKRGAGVRFTEDALVALERYAWPGNVRQLQHVMTRLAVLLPNEVIDAARLDELGVLGADGRRLRREAAPAPTAAAPALGREAHDGRACTRAVLDAAFADASAARAAGGKAPTVRDLLELAAAEEALRRENGKLSGAARLMGISDRAMYRLREELAKRPRNDRG